MDHVKLLECTLRDGSYAVGFRIDADTSFWLASALCELGIENIEVGHGLGLGAWRTHPSGARDSELWKKLAPVAEKARLYSFFIPYVGQVDDIRMARDAGLHGIRFGIEPQLLSRYTSQLEAARGCGGCLALNLMKTYTLSPPEIGNLVRDVKDLVDVVYLTDSTGHMLPGEMADYLKAIRDQVGPIPLGYHGHNNLGLAVATALELIDLGVEYIDTTLTGIGRCGGNVPTETMIAILSRQRLSDRYNDALLLRVLALAEEFHDYVVSHGSLCLFRADDILYGYAGFHSSFEPLCREYAARRGLDYHQMVLDISRIEKTHLDEDTLDRLLKGNHGNPESRREKA